jgi:DNA-binding MarR family transcriptional regulator
MRTLPSGPVLDLNSHIPTKVAVLANRLSRSASRFYRKEFGIGVVEWRLLMFIGHAKETRANRICSETDLDKGAVSRSLGLLQGMGIVSVKEDGADGRRNNIALTAKGRALHNRLVPVAIDRQRELVEGLTVAEVHAFNVLIDRLQANISDGEPGPDDASPKPAPPVRLQLGRGRGQDRARRESASLLRTSARRG